MRASTMQMPSLASTSLRQAPMQSRRAGLPARAAVLPKPPDVGVGGTLSAKQRQKLPSKEFALPGKGEGKQGKGAGSYPIPDESHARNALARVAQHGSPAEKARVRAKVQAKYPDVGKGGGSGKHPVGCGCGNHR